MDVLLVIRECVYLGDVGAFVFQEPVLEGEAKAKVRLTKVRLSMPHKGKTFLTYSIYCVNCCCHSWCPRIQIDAAFLRM